MSEPAIDLQQVSLSLTGPAGPVNILHGVDLTVEAGAALGVVGPSGSGKSTMMMVVAGLERAQQGRVHIAGRDLSAMGEDGLAAFRRERVGIVFQSFHLIPTMTALENVAVPLELAGRAGLPMPAVYIVRDPSPNAFATGRGFTGWACLGLWAAGFGGAVGSSRKPAGPR